jgi:hypothetical protein
VQTGRLAPVRNSIIRVSSGLAEVGANAAGSRSCNAWSMLHAVSHLNMKVVISAWSPLYHHKSQLSRFSPGVLRWRC